MAMPDMSYTQNAGGYNLQTGPAPSFSVPSGGMGGMEGIFQEMARRKAAAADEERRRFEIEDARRADMHRAQLAMMAPESGPLAAMRKRAEMKQLQEQSDPTVTLRKKSPIAYDPFESNTYGQVAASTVGATAQERAAGSVYR